jgi:hypothetical protein
MKKLYSASILFFVLFALFGLSLVDSSVDDITGKLTIGADCNGCLDYDGYTVLDPYICSDDQPWYCNRYEEVPGSDFWSCELIMNCQECGCRNGYTCMEDGRGCVADNNDPDPGTKTHMECIEFGGGEYYQCLEVSGPGTEECTIDDDCYNETYIWHSVCEGAGEPGGLPGEGMTCRSQLGPGRHECYADINECLPEFLDRCDDHTWDGDCFWGSRPMYCDGGTPVDNCQECGCPSSGSDDYEYICEGDGSCDLVVTGYSEGDVEDLLEFKNVTIPTQSRLTMEELFGRQLFYALQFRRYEKPLAIRYIGPHLFAVTQKLPPKPDLEFKEDTLVDENAEGVQMSPPRDVVVITGLAALPEGVYLSPGDREEEFNLILDVIDGIPIIDLQL